MVLLPPTTPPCSLLLLAAYICSHALEMITAAQDTTANASQASSTWTTTDGQLSTLLMQYADKVWGASGCHNVSRFDSVNQLVVGCC